MCVLANLEYLSIIIVIIINKFDPQDLNALKATGVNVYISTNPHQTHVSRHVLQQIHNKSK